MKPILLFPVFGIIIVMLLPGLASINDSNELPEKHVEVVLRKLGHELLLSAKDSTSRVLPVKKINSHSYQLSFENDFSFISDSLINLVQRSFQQTDLAKDYIVSLKQCKQDETVFAFEINSHNGDLTPCRGRTLQQACYIIQVDLLKKNGFPFIGWWLLLLIPLGVAGYYLAGKWGKKATQPQVADGGEFTVLGKFKLYAHDHLLSINGEQIVLSEKESKALQIFSENVNKVIDREQLMKAIWEDNGVVVMSRNVDVLISKLRKKLSADPAIKFVNVHGRGYKMMIG